MLWLTKICRGWPSYNVCHHVIVPSLLPESFHLGGLTQSQPTVHSAVRWTLISSCPMLSYYVLLLCLSMWPCALVMVQYLEDVIKHSERIPACLRSIPPCCCASLCCFCCLLFGFCVLCFVSSRFLPPRMSTHIRVFYTPPVVIKTHNIFLFVGSDGDSTASGAAFILLSHAWYMQASDASSSTLPLLIIHQYIMLASGFFLLFYFLCWSMSSLFCTFNYLLNWQEQNRF